MNSHVAVFVITFLIVSIVGRIIINLIKLGIKLYKNANYKNHMRDNYNMPISQSAFKTNLVKVLNIFYGD
jgi:hypothetical protein